MKAANDITVTAKARETIVSVAVGAGGGTVGVAGTVSVTVLNVHTYACTGAVASLDDFACTSGGATHEGREQRPRRRERRVEARAHRRSRSPAATSASASRSESRVVDKDTQAYVGGGSVVDALAGGAALGGIYDGNFDSTGDFEKHGTFHGFAVQAASSEDVFGLAPAIGGGFVGVAGGVGVTILDVTTKAFVGPSSSVNQLGGADSSQSVNVSAVDHFKSITIAGGAAFGFVGVAGGVDIGFANSTVQAYLGAGSNVAALSNVEVNALSRKEVQTYALSVGVGCDRRRGVGLGLDGRDEGDEHVPRLRRRPVPRHVVVGDGELGRPERLLQGRRRRHVRRRLHGVQRYSAKKDHPLLDPTHASDWQAPTDAMQGNSGSVTAADKAAGSGGSGGYASVFAGTTGSTAAAPAWVSGTAYNKGDVVTDTDGRTYRATQNIVATTTHPKDNADEWAGAGGERKTNSRISNAMAGPQTNINGAAAGVGGSVATTAISTVPSAGTTATIDGTVSAGGHVHVWAKDDLDVFGIAGAAAGGLGALGASILVMSVKSNTDAGVGPSASISATSGEVSVFAGMDEHSTMIALHRRGSASSRSARRSRSSTTAARRTRTSTTAPRCRARAAGSRSASRPIATSTPTRSASPSAASRPARRSAS